jgi:hypothetical protein
MTASRKWLKDKFGTTAMIVGTLAFDGIIFLAWIWTTKVIGWLSPDDLPQSPSDPSISIFKSLADYSTLCLAGLFILRDIVAASKGVCEEFKK